MVSLHRGRFVVVHLYSTFSVDHQSFPQVQIYTKNCDFSRFFWGCRPTFLKPERWNLARGCGLKLPFPAKFYKNRFLDKYVPKITNFGDFGAISTHFKSDTRVRAWECLVGDAYWFLVSHGDPFWRDLGKFSPKNRLTTGMLPLEHLLIVIVDA